MPAQLLVRDLRVEKVAAWLREWSTTLAARARALGFDVPMRHAPGIVGLRPSSAMPDAVTIVGRMQASQPRPVLVSERFGVIRISPHLYNDHDDLECLVSALAAAVGHASSGRSRL